MSTRQSVTFSDQAEADLRAEAERLGISVSDVVRRIVDQWRDWRDGGHQARRRPS